MRLERLEIAGFKSFSDRSELAFDHGVTAIVGPNGCGKSNVADAITWVLGEQSAKSLRGDRMEDVIFSGSDARKPTATAEVRLRLTGVTSLPGANGAGGNGNGHAAGVLSDAGQEPRPVSRDVELVRRLYRSGESEYLIDGEQCRLRDIHELLMDTGLGAKAYAIIEQGKIGMILASRPTDRRQLIEEAAGITKYKARRRSAELKLEAAQQNLTRIDDIVYEVEKQRGSLKRQAARARRHQRLRDELRRWEKVLFARRHRELAQVIESARSRLSEARTREAAAAAGVAELDTALGRLRLEVAEADARATTARDRAHAHELDIQRTEQQVELNRQQVAVLTMRLEELAAEEASLAARREPQRQQIEARRETAVASAAEREAAAERLAVEQQEYQTALREVEAAEGEVEQVRTTVFAALNAVTALRHAIEQAAAARERAQEGLSRIDVEEQDLRVEAERLGADRVAAEQALAEAQAALAAARRQRTSLDEQLASARAAQATLAGQLRTREHDLAGRVARLRSLEELDLARAGYTDAARVLLAQANGTVEQRGAVADYLEVDRADERAVEAALGDLLQHVLVPSHTHAAAGLQLLREQEAGRGGFLVIDAAAGAGMDDRALPPGFRSLAAVLRVAGPHADVIRAAIGEALIAPSLDDAIAVARETGATVVTPEGDLLRGGAVVVGGGRREARGILATKGEIKDLRARVDAEGEAVAALQVEVTAAQALVAETLHGIERVTLEVHDHEKAIVGFEAQLTRARDEAGRLERKGEVLTTERRRGDEELARLDARRQEAEASIVEREARRQEADELFVAAQRRLAAAREQVEGRAARMAEARASHAALVERATALAADVERLEEAARELEMRLTALAAEQVQKREQRAGLEEATTEAIARLDGAVADLETRRREVRDAEEAAAAIRARVEEQDAAVHQAREALDTVRAGIAELEVARATAESDLHHLASACLESVQASLEEVVAEVHALEQEGAVVPDARTLSVDEGIEEDEEGAAAVPAGEAAGAPLTLTAEEAIAGLRAKIDRLGPVNMMAIEQFDELEARHTFLTTQRKDLVDSIAATNDAIQRIDETSRVRFREAFDAINRNFQETFSTLFGGGRAGITLLDEADPLESGIDIVASPPGKRLQSVQLLSGGEKALTAIALMFAIFKYKPSPFCLLDEIDAPLDDANIGRFVEMLRGMLHHTQFILITHNRKTMEIADRLYGVTMEEPGVSRLISVRLN